MEAENTHQVFGWLWSSGQLSVNDISNLATLDIEAVINLSLPNSTNALCDEFELVTAQNLTYINIPVEWEKPNPEQFFEFARILQDFSGGRIWVHCAKNMRASVFIYLFRKLILGESEDAASFPMRAVWRPNKIWWSFINQVCKIHSTHYLSGSSNDAVGFKHKT